MNDESHVNVLEKFIAQSAHQRGQRSSFPWVRVVVCVALYLLVMRIQATQDIPDYVNGILAQIQAILSLYLALSVLRTGFFVALGLNVFNLGSIFIAVVLMHKTSAVTGLIVVGFNLISITIISILASRNARHLAEVMHQKEELLHLSKSIVESKEELSRQNGELIQAYQLISKNEEKLSFLAYFDTLTELPNRKMMLDRLDLLVSLAHKNRASFAVVFIDLDDFKKINDTMGHQIGDALIVAVAARLNALVQKDDLLGRLGGDEFALIIQQELRDEEILHYVDHLRASLEQVFHIERYELFIRASFGISIYPQDGCSPTELIQCADTAMYKAKETGKNGIYFFRKEMQDEILQKMDFETKLQAALQHEEFFVVFQPQYYAQTSVLRGLEALVRWQSPDYGLVSPLRFIATAEETGLIVPLGQWILRTACLKFKGLIERYHFNDVILSVNISAIQFDDPGFIAMLQAVLDESGLPPQNLELEITESVLIKSLDQTRRILDAVKAIGVKIALDDFGTGYSSLRYLQLLPIDTLKIDKSFVDHIRPLEESQQIIGGIIALVHQMNIQVVAEGVENEAQLDYLCREECDAIQGNLLGKAIPLPDLLKILDSCSPGAYQARPIPILLEKPVVSLPN